MKPRLLAVALVLCAGCGKSSPTAPTPPVQTPQPITLTVHVTATNGGQPLPGVAGDVGGVTALTNADGGAQYQLSPGAAQRLSLSGSGIVPRSLMVAVGASRDVSVNAIATNGFDLNFYRELARNGFEEPGSLQPLRRWTTPPNVYIRTVRDDGPTVDAATLNTVEQVIRDAMPTWAGFGPASVVRGTDAQVGRAGWLTVRWPGVVAADRVCGRSDVAVSGGEMQLYVPTATACGCDGTARIRPRTVRHELGHAMGFFHTDNPADVMFIPSGLCDLQPSARERAAAAIAYARPVGNTDPDVDPSSAVSLAPMTAR